MLKIIFSIILFVLCVPACTSQSSASSLGIIFSDAAPTSIDVQKTGVKVVLPVDSQKVPNVLKIINENLKNLIELGAEVEAKYLASHYSVADRFAEAGGVKLCEAFVLAMSPEWGFSFCDLKADPTVRAECIASRQPLIDFGKEICEAAVDESLRLEVDPGMVMAVFENESNLGKVRFNRWTKTFYVGTDVRPPAWRDAGETGIAQLLPNDYPRGICVGRLANDGKTCLGEKLNDVTQFDRRAALIAHPAWQTRIGIREIAEHRDICLEYVQVDPDEFWTWISTYNQGRCKQAKNVFWSQWIRYATRVMKQYIDACNNGIYISDDGVPKLIKDVWDECAKVEAAYPRLMRQR